MKQIDKNPSLSAAAATTAEESKPHFHVDVVSMVT